MRSACSKLVGLAAGAAVLFAPMTLLGSFPGMLPPACVAIDQAPLNLQTGYAPGGPDDCIPLPRA